MPCNMCDREDESQAMSRDLAREFIENRTHAFEPYNAGWVKPRCTVCQEFEEHPIHDLEVGDFEIRVWANVGEVLIQYTFDKMVESGRQFTFDMGPFGKRQAVLTKAVVDEAGMSALMTVRFTGD